MYFDVKKQHFTEFSKFVLLATLVGAVNSISYYLFVRVIAVDVIIFGRGDVYMQLPPIETLGITRGQSLKLVLFCSIIQISFNLCIY